MPKTDAEVMRDLKEMLTRGAFLAGRAGLEVFAPGTKIEATVFDEIPGAPHLKEILPGEVMLGPFPDGPGGDFTYFVKLNKPWRGMAGICVAFGKLRKVLP